MNSYSDAQRLVDLVNDIMNTRRGPTGEPMSFGGKRLTAIESVEREIAQMVRKIKTISPMHL